MQSAPVNSALSLQWKRVRRNLQDYGAGRTLSKVVNSVASSIYYNRAYTLYRGDLGRLPLPKMTDGSLIFRFIELGESKYLAQILQLEEWLGKRLDAIIKDGGSCLVALDGERIAGFNLVSFKQIHLPVVAFTRALRPGQAYSEQITVDKAYRGRNLGTILRMEVFRALRAQGTRVIYGGTDVNNKANLALCGKVGLKTIANIRLIKFLGFSGTTIQRRRS